MGRGRTVFGGGGSTHRLCRKTSSSIGWDWGSSEGVVSPLSETATALSLLIHDDDGDDGGDSASFFVVLVPLGSSSSSSCGGGGGGVGSVGVVFESLSLSSSSCVVVGPYLHLVDVS